MYEVFKMYLNAVNIVGSCGLVIDPLDSAIGFYRKLGLFTEFKEPNSEDIKLFISTKDIKNVL